MKKKAAVVIIAVVLASIFFGSGMYVGAATKSGAGSQNDPVVTLSYLDYRLEKLGETSGIGKQGNAGNGTGTTGQESAVWNTGFKKVILSRGERYLSGEGGVIVLYSGTCTAVGKGLIDITNAKVIAESESIPAYSQMLVPDDSSGIVAGETCVIYVNG